VSEDSGVGESRAVPYPPTTARARGRTFARALRRTGRERWGSVGRERLQVRLLGGRKRAVPGLNSDGARAAHFATAGSHLPVLAGAGRDLSGLLRLRHDDLLGFGFKAASFDSMVISVAVLFHLVLHRLQRQLSISGDDLW
jgi:hypothetical protein